MLSVYERDILALREKLQRVSQREIQGRSVTSYLSVDVSTLEGLLDDHDELMALKELTVGTKVIDPTFLERGVGTVAAIEDGTERYPIKVTVSYGSVFCSGIQAEHLRKL